MLPFSIQITVPVVLRLRRKKSEINPCKNHTYRSKIQATGVDIYKNLRTTVKVRIKGIYALLKGKKVIELIGNLSTDREK